MQYIPFDLGAQKMMGVCSSFQTGGEKNEFKLTGGDLEREGAAFS